MFLLIKLQIFKALLNKLFIDTIIKDYDNDNGSGNGNNNNDDDDDGNNNNNNNNSNNNNIIIIVKAKVNLKTSCKPILLVYSSASSFASFRFSCLLCYLITWVLLITKSFQ